MERRGTGRAPGKSPAAGRLRRALAERNVDGPARGPAREGQNELEEQVLQGVSAESQNTLGGAGVLATDADNRAEINES